MDLSLFFNSQRFRTLVMMAVGDIESSVTMVESNESAVNDIVEFMGDDANDVEEIFMQPFIVERLLNLIVHGVYVSNFVYWLNRCKNAKTH
jgi:hypothetical protein